MKLHRSDSQPDWEKITQNERNIWQRIAAVTFGIATLANVATFIGIVLVIVGLLEIVDQNYWWGCVLIIVGRLFDLLDGWLAEATRTKSPLGELLDASIDKLGTVLTVVAFYVAALAPWWVLTALLLPHIVIIFISLNARRNGIILHPSKTGKLSMAAVWAALFGLVLIEVLDLPLWNIGTVAVYSTAIVSVILGAAAATGYLFNRD